MKKALLFGSSGFIGSYLLHELLADPGYDRITVVVRKDPGIAHPKLHMLLGDYRSLPGLGKDLVADEIFIALGTTRKNTPDQDEYYRIDHDYPVLAAKLAEENGAKSVFIVTAVGPDAHSKLFYVRTKGEVERDILALGFEHTHLFRPSMLLGNRKEHRSLEKALIRVWPLIHPFLIGSLSKYRGMDGKDIAKAMVRAARGPQADTRIYHWADMKALI